MSASEHYPLPQNPFGHSGALIREETVPLNLPHRDVVLASNKVNLFLRTKLTHRQRLFVDSYLSSGFDPAVAALAGFFTNDPKQALTIGRRLLKKPAINEAIQLSLDYYTEKSKFRFNRNRYLQELESIALFNLADFLDENGTVVIPSEEDRRQKLAGLGSFKQKTTTRGRGSEAEHETSYEVKGGNKLEALKELLRLEDQANTKLIEHEEAVSASGYRPINFTITSVPSGQFLPAPKNPLEIAPPDED